MKSVAAVFAGYLSMAVLVVLTTALVAGVMLGESTTATAPYLLVNLTYSSAFAALGGWVTARLAPRARSKHVVVLACLVAALALASAVASPATTQPGWYGWAIVAVGGVGVLAGGLLLSRPGSA